MMMFLNSCCLYYLSCRVANIESVEPIMNMVMNKPDEDTLEEVPQSPQQSPPSVQWNTPPPIFKWLQCWLK